VGGEHGRRSYPRGVSVWREAKLWHSGSGRFIVGLPTLKGRWHGADEGSICQSFRASWVGVIARTHAWHAHALHARTRARAHTRATRAYERAGRLPSLPSPRPSDPVPARRPSRRGRRPIPACHPHPPSATVPHAAGWFRGVRPALQASLSASGNPGTARGGARLAGLPARVSALPRMPPTHPRALRARDAQTGVLAAPGAPHARPAPLGQLHAADAR